MRIITDIFEYCSKEVPKWNTISISGYLISGRPDTAVQELAFTLSNGKAYVKAALKRSDIDVFGKRLSFFLTLTTMYFRVAKISCCPENVGCNDERDGAKDPRAMMLRFHTQTGGSTPMLSKPMNNIIRV